MAAEIAKDAGLIAGRRTQANFIPLSPRDGEFGAYLNCEGTFGLNLRFVSPPGAPQEWYQFVVRSASILTKAKPTIVREGAEQCVNAALQSSHGFADLEHGKIRFFCDTDEKTRVELTITNGQ
jgi:hypothetical protein